MKTHTAKKLTAAATAGLMALSLAACGGSPAASGAAGSAASTASTTDTASSASAAEGEPITLTATWWGGQSRHDYTQKLFDLYTSEHPNVTFKTVPSGWDGYFDKLATQTASGSMPDIVQMDYLYISTYAKNNSVADLQEFIDNGTIDTTNIDPNILNTGKIDGKMAGLVLATSIQALGYNPSVLEEAGVEAPTSDWTWSDYTTMMNTVYEKTGKLGTCSGPVEDTNQFSYWVRQHGKNLFSDDNKSLGYDDDAVCTDFLQMWKDLMDAKSAPNPDQYAQISTLGQEASPIVTNDAATLFEWNNYTNKVSSVNPNLKLATPPLSDDADAAKGLWLKPGMFFSVAETSPNKQAAAEFINWFINSEEANDIIMAERGTPVSSAIREYMIDSGKMTDQQKDMFAYVDTATALCGDTPAPDPTGMSEVNRAFKDAAYSAFYGQVTCAEAAATFREQADAILSQNN